MRFETWLYVPSGANFVRRGSSIYISWAGVHFCMVVRLQELR